VKQIHPHIALELFSIVLGAKFEFSVELMQTDIYKTERNVGSAITESLVICMLLNRGTETIVFCMKEVRCSLYLVWTLY
jgi:hypothetical protein